MSLRIDSFLEMMAAERGAADNTLESYRRDLEDAAAFLPHIPQKFYPAEVLGVEVYRQGAIRGIGLGALAFATKDEATGETVYPKLELFRLAINRRTYTNSHMEYVAQSIVDVYKRRDRIRYGLEVGFAPAAKGLHHFLAHLHPVQF